MYSWRGLFIGQCIHETSWAASRALHCSGVCEWKRASKFPPDLQMDVWLFHRGHGEHKLSARAAVTLMQRDRLSVAWSRRVLCEVTYGTMGPLFANKTWGLSRASELFSLGFCQVLVGRNRKREMGVGGAVRIIWWIQWRVIQWQLYICDHLQNPINSLTSTFPFLFPLEWF